MDSSQYEQEMAVDISAIERLLKITTGSVMQNMKQWPLQRNVGWLTELYPQR
jgi:hypothetical protein